LRGGKEWGMEAGGKGKGRGREGKTKERKGEGQPATKNA